MTLARIRVAYCSVVAALLAATWTTAAGQGTPPGRETSAESVGSYALSQQMPVDPEVTVGTLPNGLRYYVRANAKPARRAELRLVIKAGSVLEDDNQQGLAHFVEHMLFEGTRNFPQQGISEFLATLGVGIGPDANAQTSYDDTQYLLRVPTDVPGVLNRAMLVLEDWAQAATFDPEAIGSVASFSRNGACTSAPASGPRTSCARCSWRDRATPIDPRSASPRSSSASSASSCSASIATGIARI